MPNAEKDEARGSWSLWPHADVTKTIKRGLPAGGYMVS